MKIVRVSFIVVCSILLAFGCASFPEPTESSQTLVIGEIVQQGKGYRFYGSASVNGTNRSGIEITIQDLNSEKPYTIRSRPTGLFYSINIPEGTYKVTRVFLRKESGGGWASITWNAPKDADRSFEIVNGKVNNFGLINWECESGEKNFLYYNKEYGQAKDTFMENYKSSKWNEREWINISVKRDSSEQAG